MRSQIRTDSSTKRFNAHLEHKASNETDKAISFINNHDLGWKADTCKLQSHHAEYGSHCEAQKKAHSLAQTSSDVVENTKQNEFGPKSGKKFDRALAKAQSWYNKYKTADEIPDSVLPESYDFRNLDGFDFTNPLRDQ